MNLQQVREMLPGHDVDRMWRQFRQQNRGADLADFAAQLGRDGLLDKRQVRALLTEGEVSFTLSEAAGQARAGIDAQFELLSLLGKGAMGEVHIARDRALNRNVAVKIMDPALAKDANLRRRFLTEVQVTAQLDHPSIVPVYGLERRADGSLGYSMRIVRGRELGDLIEETRQFYAKKKRPDDEHNLASRLDVFVELCQAVHYAHTRGVIHRDLKPENIMVGAFGEVMVMDWGIARLIGSDEEPVPDLSLSSMKDALKGATQIGMVIGTPPYMSPEQAQGLNDQLDGKSDQYALGLILFELVALKPALTGKNAIRIVQRAQEGEKDAFTHAFGDAIPRELQAIVAKATALRPEHRYADVAELAADVQRYLRDEEVRAKRDTLLQRIQRWISHHRQLTLMTLFGSFSALFALGLGSVVVVGIVLAVDNYLAEQRQQRLSDMVALVAQQGHRIDGEFQHYAGEVATLAATAEYALADPNPVPRTVYFAEQFADPTVAPPDLRDAKAYDAKASLDYPDNVTAPGVDRAAIALHLQQLQSLQPHMLRMILRSSSSQAALAMSAEKQRRLVLDERVPMVWAYVATEEGVLTGLPGTGDYPDGYDPRVQTWYKRAKVRPGVQWGVEDDESGQGLLVSASTGMYDPQGRMHGVASLDLGLEHVTKKMLVPPASFPVQAYLVDDAGYVNASTQAPSKAKEREKFPYPDLVDRVAKGETTGVAYLDGEVLVWCRLDVVEWTYVVAADEGDVFGSWL